MCHYGKNGLSLCFDKVFFVKATNYLVFYLYLCRRSDMQDNRLCLLAKALYMRNEKTLFENRVSAGPRNAAARTLRLIALLRKVFLIKVFALQR